MAISLRSTSSATGSGSQSSIAVPKPTGAGADDILIARVTTAAPAQTINTLSGWTADASSSGVTASGSDHRLSTFYRRVDGSEGSSFTFSFAGSAFCQAQMYCYSGCTTSGSPIESSSFNPSGASSGTTITATGLTITNATKLLFIGSTFGNAAPSSAPSGMTFRVASDNQTMSDLVVTAGSTGNKTLTISSDFWSGALIALLPAGGSDVTATGATTQAAATLAGAATETIAGAGATTQAPGTPTGALAETILGVGAIAQAAGALAGVGTVGSDAVGAGAVTQPAGVLAGALALNFDVVAAGAITQPLGALAGAALEVFAGAGATVQVSGLLAGVGVVGDVVSGLPVAGPTRAVVAEAGRVGVAVAVRRYVVRID